MKGEKSRERGGGWRGESGKGRVKMEVALLLLLAL